MDTEQLIDHLGEVRRDIADTADAADVRHAKRKDIGKFLRLVEEELATIINKLEYADGCTDRG